MIELGVTARHQNAPPATAARGHTWPERQGLTLDVYVCNFSADNSAKARKLFDDISAHFQPAEVARHGITVTVVSPATVDTPLLRGMLTPEQIERREKANPMGRLGRPEDVAAAVVFFASPGAGYVTGQVLSVNGGVVRAGSILASARLITLFELPPVLGSGLGIASAIAFACLT